MIASIHFILIGALLCMILIFMVIVTLTILRNARQLKERASLNPEAVKAASRMEIVTCLHFKELRNKESENEFDKGWDAGFDAVIAYQSMMIASMLDGYQEIDFEDPIIKEEFNNFKKAVTTDQKKSDNQPSDSDEE